MIVMLILLLYAYLFLHYPYWLEEKKVLVVEHYNYLKEFFEKLEKRRNEKKL